jgi:hypothetical protein
MYQRLSAHLTSVEILSEFRESASRISSSSGSEDVPAGGPIAVAGIATTSNPVTIPKMTRSDSSSYNK